jgi:hypothetical protein
MLVVGLFLGTTLGPSYYWAATLIVVPVLIIPLTYRQLVGGGCSVRFQICALVKGMLVGFVFFFLTVYLDPLIWGSIESLVEWNPLVSPEIAETVYYTWLFSGLLGGVGARVVEVRGYSQSAEVTIAGFE